MPLSSAFRYARHGRLREHDVFGSNRHREDPRDGARGDAIQSPRSGPSSLDRLAYARDDDRGSTRLHRALGVLRALGVVGVLLSSGAARADALDDTVARFLVDKFPQTEAAVSELAAEAPPQAAAILEALGDNRLLIDPADHLVAYKTAAGAILNAKTGAPVEGVDAAAFKKSASTTR
jgi:hypothetical protein